MEHGIKVQVSAISVKSQLKGQYPNQQANLFLGRASRLDICRMSEVHIDSYISKVRMKSIFKLLTSKWKIREEITNRKM